MQSQKQPSQYSGSTYGHGGAPHHAPSQMSVASSAHRRSAPPPRFRPFMIIVLVLAVGLLFIGLIMTIIAVWPGYTPVGGNPLKIAGPVILAIGGFVLIVAIINICWNSEKQREKQMQRQQLMYSQSASRSTIASAYQQPQTPTPSIDARPQKSILKKGGSTSTYNGTAKSHEDLNHSQSFGTNRSYERDSSSDQGSAHLDNVNISMNPDPSYRPQPRGPAPVRGQGYSNRGYGPDGRETDIDGDISNRRPDVHQQQTPPRRAMQTYSNGGYDAYDAGAVTGQASLTGAGMALTGQGMMSPSSLTGAGLMSPYGAGGSSPYGGGGQAPTPKRWGQGQAQQQQQQQQPRADPTHTGYNQGPITNVTQTYDQMTSPQGRHQITTRTTTTTQRQYNAPPPQSHSSPSNPTSSTEV